MAALSRPSRWLTPVVAFGGVFVVYLQTLAPTVTTEDSGELVTAAATLGVPHPPGFPLYCLLVHLFIRTGLGTPAYAANLASAVFAVVTLVALYIVLRRWRLGMGPALFAAVALGLGPTFWSQAIVAEVYTLNTALLATSLALLATGAERPGGRGWLLGAVLVAGLALANHHPLTLLAAPGLAAYAIATQRAHLRRPGTWALSLLAFVPGLALYSYLPLAASHEPPVNWGDPSTLERFSAHVRREAYRTLERGTDVRWADKAAFFQDFLALVGQEFAGPLPWLVLAALALGAWALRRAPARWFVGGVLAFNPVVLLLVLRFPYEREHVLRVNEYYLPAYLALAVVLAYAAQWLTARASRPRAHTAWATCAVVVTSGLLTHRWSAVTRAGDHLAEDFNRSVLESLEPDAIYFPSGDYATFPTLYLQACEGIRPDVLLANYTGDPSPAVRAEGRRLDPQVDTDDRGAIQKVLLERSARPVYFAAKSDVRVAGLTLDPWGLVYRARRRGERPPRQAPRVDDIAALLRNAARADYQPEDLGRSILADAHRMAGEHALAQGDTARARRHMAQAETWLATSKEGLNNLGNTWAEYGFRAEAARLYRAAAASSARYVTPRRNLAHLLERDGPRDEAIEAFEDLRRLQPEHAGLQAKLDALRRKDDDRGGQDRLQQMRRVVEAQPGNAASWNNYGSALAEAGRPEAARAAFEKALALDPTYALPHRNLAILLEQTLGDQDAAAHHRAEYEKLRK